MDEFADSVVARIAAEQRARHVRAIAADKRGRIARNKPCPCGSGAKYKRCCRRKETTRDAT